MVKINWKRKRIVGKANNGTNRKNNNRKGKAEQGEVLDSNKKNGGVNA